MSEVGRDPLATSVLFDVFALNQALGQYLAEAMAGSPLTPAEYAIYSAIFEPEQISPSGLTARLGMPLTTVIDVIARLEARGHARRIPNPRDRRASLVVLTAEGLRAHREANRTFEGAAAELVAALPRGEDAAKAGLAEVRSAVERAATTRRQVARA